MENTAANPQKIFFSYSRKDGQDYAFKLAGDLRTAGANVWMDQMDIEPGRPWDLEVEKALNTSDCVLFIATEKAVSSEKVLNEVYYALDENKRILPAVFHDCPIPFQLRRLQRIDFTANYNAGFRRLLKAIGLKETDAASAQPGEQKTSESTVEPIAVTQETPVVIPKEEPVKMTMATAGVERNRNEEDLTTPSPFINDEQKKSGSKKALFWGLGVAVAALLIFVLVQNISGKDNDAASNGDSTLLLGKTGETKPGDTSTLSSEFVEGKKPGGTTSTPDNDDKAKTGNGEANPSTDNAAEKQKQFEAFRQAGINNFNAKNYKEAIDNLSDALRLQGDAELYYYIGRSCGELQDYASAIVYYSKAIELAPHKAGYFGSRGLAYRNNKDYKAALQDFDQAILLNGNDGQPYNNRGTIKQLLNDLAGACQDFATAAKLGYETGQTNYNSYCQQKPSTNLPPINKELKRLDRTKIPYTDPNTAKYRKLHPVN